MLQVSPHTVGGSTSAERAHGAPRRRPSCSGSGRVGPWTTTSGRPDAPASRRSSQSSRGRQRSSVNAIRGASAPRQAALRFAAGPASPPAITCARSLPAAPSGCSASRRPVSAPAASCATTTWKRSGASVRSSSALSSQRSPSGRSCEATAMATSGIDGHYEVAVGPAADEPDRLARYEPRGLASDEPRGLALGGRGLREHTARGTLINGAYLTGVYSLNLARGFVVAALLSVGGYGIWGIVAIALAMILQLKQVGIGDKYVQQSDPDQERAFQRAFTLELGITGAFALLMVAVMPLLALAYGRWDIVAPGMVLALAPVGAALQSPVWVFYRRMDFVRQRRLQAVDPLTAFAVTVALAGAGAGYWSLVVGTVAGAWAGAAVALAACPYRLGLRFDRGAAREYLGFSWPLFAAGLTPIVMAQGSILAGERTLGLAAVGVIVLASSIADYTNRVDAILTETLYPAICAMRDRTALLAETFVKSNRLALMWGVPFGVGLALFAGDIVHFGLGDRWESGIGLIRAFGLIAAINHIAFNWDAFYRARGDTRPVAVWSAASLVVFLAAAPPLPVPQGPDGPAVGLRATAA